MKYLILLIALTVPTFAQFAFQDGDAVFIRDVRPTFIPLGPGITLHDFLSGAYQSPLTHNFKVSDADTGTAIQADGEGGVWEVPLAQALAMGQGEYLVYRFDIYKLLPAWIPPCFASFIRNWIVKRQVKAARSYLGLPYDIDPVNGSYTMDKARVYCSELEYHSFRDVTGLDVAPLQFVADLNWQPYAVILAAFNIQLTQQVITPLQLTKSPYYTLVHREGFEDGWDYTDSGSE